MTTIRKIIIEPETAPRKGSSAHAATQTSHSPLPWEVHTDKKTGWPQVISATKPNGKRAIVALFPATEENEIKSANAAFIVRACNNAQRLAENCKIMLSRVEAILQCDEALQGCLADDAFGETYEDLLRADKKELREALAQWEKDKQ